MKRNIILAILALLVGLGATAFATGKKNKNEAFAFPIQGNYSKLIVNRGFDVSFSDSVKAAMVTIPENLKKQMIVEVYSDTLRLDFRGNVKFKKRPTIVLPRNKRLNNIELSGTAVLTAGKIEQEVTNIYLTGAAEFRGDIVGKEAHIMQEGASDYRGHMAVENLFVNIAAASSMEIRGRVFFKLDIKMIEASTLDAEKLEVRRIEGSLDGASNAIVWCTERMVVPVKNASHLIYIGRPLVVNCPTSDVSTVTHK